MNIYTMKNAHLSDHQLQCFSTSSIPEIKFLPLSELMGSLLCSQLFVCQWFVLKSTVRLWLISHSSYTMNSYFFDWTRNSCLWLSMFHVKCVCSIQTASLPFSWCEWIRCIVRLILGFHAEIARAKCILAAIFAWECPFSVLFEAFERLVFPLHFPVIDCTLNHANKQSFVRYVTSLWWTWVVRILLLKHLIFGYNMLYFYSKFTTCKWIW